ncbi:MAG: SEC-C metal-binding domain-containing protein, partial [Rhodanobacteraceae bacterium]
REAFRLFEDMLARIKKELVQTLARVRIRSEEEVAAMEAEQRRIAAARAMDFQHAETAGFGGAAPQPGAGALPGSQPMRLPAPEGAMGDAAESAVATATPMVRSGPKIGRNDPCPCGSGKKYKHCHGALS